MPAANDNGLVAANNQPVKTLTNNATDFRAKPAEFVGTANPRYLRAIQALLTRPVPRQQLDEIVGCANGPDAILNIRDLFTDGRGKQHLTCQRIDFVDRDGNLCKPGIYSFAATGRRMIYAWIAKRAKGSAAFTQETEGAA